MWGYNMNDFTKEELMIFIYYEEQANGQSPLYDKIKSMIENYCEHESYRKDEWMICICNKCHKVFDDE
jgi:hypothetical protein